MILTDLELRVMKAGNPPELGEIPPRQHISDYTEQEQQELIYQYEKKRWGYRRLAISLGWHPDTARTLLYKHGVMRTKKTIPNEHYAILKKLLSLGLKTPQIAKRTGWKERYVRNLRENLRKREYYKPKHEN